jgi:hypothetical protein
MSQQPAKVLQHTRDRRQSVQLDEVAPTRHHLANGMLESPVQPVKVTAAGSA